MREVLDRIEDRGVARGMAQGMSQGIARGIAQGMVQGEEKKAMEMAVKLHQMGMKPEDIAGVANEPVSKVRQWLGLPAVPVR
ncbi:MAG: hypothetical protein IJ646_11520 [Clostridia bacterium]|nr:hypothetical protein [Clostridia bacterium]